MPGLEVTVGIGRRLKRESGASRCGHAGAAPATVGEQRDPHTATVLRAWEGVDQKAQAFARKPGDRPRLETGQAEGRVAGRCVSTGAVSFPLPLVTPGEYAGHAEDV